MATILILGVKIPFTRGGQDVLVKSLTSELIRRGHDVDTVELPLSMMPKESLATQAAMWRSLDLTSVAGRKVDLVIATKFPSYYARHPKKSIWLVHQHRPIYDLFGGRYSDFSDDPRDDELRRMLVAGDTATIGEAAYVSGISKNVIERLKMFNGISGTPLYPPLAFGAKYKPGPYGDYILSVGRLCSIKRTDLIIKALPFIHNVIKLKIVGTADEPGVMDYFKNEIDKHHLNDRVEFLGRASDEQTIELYSGALAVYYAPYNEDYGYVTLEAMASSKPVVTAHDSGGVLEFITHDEHGLVVEPNSEAIGMAVNRLVDDRAYAQKLGLAGRAAIEKSGLLTSGWDAVVRGLLSPLDQDQR